ncbi:mandelate racemase/muconate lactonizing enzyme family protein [Arthrobacter sp. MYb213]|uniref:mandelate racemase/muconate lactonizing enzyme family protein n=1 Tax=Arthrobacter sp. MYb213 TaxID=1848595 RepID=UPI000CFACCFE|nr:mandelate racemase/muconate lactonizing enzyme family protein [Arthrobacter sp. MYb213]PRB66771.1 mandelate racemase [Arthrobacter sp. MYb213]
MKITDIDVIELRGASTTQADSTQQASIIRIETDTGHVGYGQSEAAAAIVRAAVDISAQYATSEGLRSSILGQDPRRIHHLWDRMYNNSLYFGRRGAVPMAMSGVDIALYDLVGKTTELPIYQLLGGKRHERIPTYASLLAPTSGTETSTLIRTCIDRGFRAAKLAWGGLGSSLENDIELVGAAREAAGPDFKLMLDIGFAWENSDRAIRTLNQLERFGLEWVEEPVHPDRRADYRRLTAHSPVRIAGGEGLTTRFEFADLLDNEGVQVLQPDVMKCGGITEMRRIFEYADMRGATCVPHCWNTGIGRAAAIHVLASSGNAPLLEYCTEISITDSLISGAPQMIDGSVTVSDAPGLGISIDDEALGRLAANPVNILSPIQ